MALSNTHSTEGLISPDWTKTPPYHPFDADTGGLVEGAHTVIALPLPFGRKGVPGPYAPGSVSWNQLNPKYQHGDLFALALHLFIMCLELPENGTPAFFGNPGTAHYEHSVLAFLRTLEGQPRRFDDKILKVDVHITHGSSYDPLLANILFDIKTGSYDGVLGRDARDAADNDNLMDGVDYVMPDENFGAGAGRQRARHFGGDDDEDDEAAIQAEDDARIASLIRDLLAERRGGVAMAEKVKIIVKHFTRPVAEGSQMMEDAGCVVFFCIMDPLFSIGKAMARMLDMCEAYDRYSTGVKSAKEQGGARKRGRNTNDKPDLLNLFPWLESADHKNNALLTASRAKYLELVALAMDNKHMTQGHMRDTNLFLAKSLHDPGTRRNRNPMHPANVFTPTWALRQMHLFGVPEEQTAIHVFRGGEDWEDARDRAMVAANFVERWYFEPQSSFHCLMEGFVWARNGRAGLVRQYFPWIMIPSVLRESMVLRTTSNALVLWQGHDEGSIIAPNYTAAMVQVGIGRPEVLPRAFFDSHAILRKSAIFQVAMENKRLMDTLVAPDNPKYWALQPHKKDALGPVTNPYSIYCDKLKEYRAAAIMNFQQVLVPSDTHIYPSMNAILSWQATEMRKVGVPLQFLTLDPCDEEHLTLPFDGFANYMIRLGLQVKHFQFVENRIDRWILVHIGAQDCHSTGRVSIHISGIFHGMSMSSKSFTVKNATEVTLIPKTVTSILSESDKTWYVHEDNVGMIIFKDEVPNYYVSQKAAENDKSGAAERLKSMTTDQRATYRSLVLVERADGRAERKAETIESLFHATLWCCTNKKIGGGDEAVASRFFNFVMTRSETDLFEMMGMDGRLDDKDKRLKNDAEHSWRIKQCLLALCQVLVDGGALPPCSMDAFDRIQARVMSYLKIQGVDTQAIRNAQMVKRLATLYTLLNGLINIYDVPGALHADVPEFELSQLLDMIPYMYCTKQIAIFTLTQTEDILLSPLRGVVLRAAMMYAKFPLLQNGETLDAVIRRDTDRSFQSTWRMHPASDGNQQKVDLNYIQLTGKYSEVCQHIAEFCEPKIGATEVQNVLESLSGPEAFIRVRPMPKVPFDVYEANFNAQTLPKFPLKRDRKEDSLKIVLRDFKADAIYIAVEALGKVHDNLLMDALAACIYEKWRPQVMLTGKQVRKAHPTQPGKDMTYSGIFEAMDINAVTVATFSGGCATFDAPDASFIPATARTVFSGPRLNPDKSDEWYVNDDNHRSSPTMSIDQDLDDWAQEQHHYRVGCAGRHTDSPARPLAIFERIRKKLLQNEKNLAWNAAAGRLEADKIRKGLLPACPMIEYPVMLLREVDEGIRKGEQARPFALRDEVIKEMHAYEVGEYEQLSAEEKRLVSKPQLLSLNESSNLVLRAFARVIQTGKNKALHEDAPEEVATPFGAVDIPYAAAVAVNGRIDLSHVDNAILAATSDRKSRAVYKASIQLSF